MASDKKARPRDAAKSAIKERRTQARKARNVAANIARKEANIAALVELGGTYDPTLKRDKPVQVTRWTGTRYETVTLWRRVSVGPSEQLIAYRRTLRG